MSARWIQNSSRRGMGATLHHRKLLTVTAPRSMSARWIQNSSRRGMGATLHHRKLLTVTAPRSMSAWWIQNSSRRGMGATLHHRKLLTVAAPRSMSARWIQNSSRRGTTSTTSAVFRHCFQISLRFSENILQSILGMQVSSWLLQPKVFEGTPVFTPVFWVWLDFLQKLLDSTAGRQGNPQLAELFASGSQARNIQTKQRLHGWHIQASSDHWEPEALDKKTVNLRSESSLLEQHL